MLANNGGSLKIDAIENKNAHKHPLPAHAVLPKHEFSMLIVAPKGSGKTNFICNLLLKHYKGYFNKVWICSPTVNNDEKWDIVKDTRNVLVRNFALEKVLDGAESRQKIKKVVFASEAQKTKKDMVKWDGKIPEVDFFTDMDELLPRLAEQQKQIDELKEMGKGARAKYIADRLLIILDDQAGRYSATSFNNPIANYVIKHRHYSSSCIIVTQAYKAIPKTIRTNCNALILFEIPNKQELKSIYEENPDNLDEKVWTAVYKACTAAPYSFMYINSHFQRGERIFRNFESQMIVHDAPKQKVDIQQPASAPQHIPERRRSQAHLQHFRGASQKDTHTSRKSK